MAFPISPGVFVQDHRRPPEWRSKGVMLFVGAFEKGPVGVPVLVASRDQARMVFGGEAGGHVTAHATAHVTAMALAQFFDQGGQAAMVLRLAIGASTADPASDPAPHPVPDPACVRPTPAADLGALAADFDPGPDPIQPGAPGWAQAVLTAFGAEDGLAPLRELVPGRVEMLAAPILSQLRLAQARDVYRKLHGLCAGKEIFLLIDPPAAPDLGAEQNIAWFEGMGLGGSLNAVALAPMLTTPHGGPALLAPSGPVAGLLDRVARRAGIWAAPTGGQAVLSGLAPVSPGGAPSQGCPPYLNCLADHGAGARFGAEGIFSMAGRDAPRLRFLRVLRNTRLTLRAECARLIEEDGPETRQSEARLIAEALMMQLWRDGALCGACPSEAYRVTTTAPDAKGAFDLCVGLALHSPGRFLWESLRLH